MFTERKSFLVFLLAFMLMALPVLNPDAVISAQNNELSGSEIMDQLLSEATAQNKTLGGLIWNLQNSQYTNLGDLTANQLMVFLQKGLSRTITLDGKTMEITIPATSAGSEEFLPQITVNISLTYEGNQESGTLTVFLDDVKNYTNQTIYPLVKNQLNMIERNNSNQLAIDLTNLLSKAAASGQEIASVTFWNSVWRELASNLSNYPAINQIFSQQSAESLVTYTSDGTAGTGYLDDLFADISSFANLTGMINTLNANPLPITILDPVSKKINDIQQNPAPVPPQPIQPEIPSFFELLFEQLPATGFSAFHVTPLRARPQNLVYGITGLTLQIPSLGVMESVVNVPVEDGTYPVEWLGSNIGMLEGSAFPGEGITVLTGHNHLNTMETGPFLFIESLEDNDRLFIIDENNEMQSFKIYANYKISYDGFATIIDNLKENSLVLITCEDESAEGGYINRRIIFAEPI